MATKKQAKQAPSDADRVFLSMQKPLKRLAKSIVKERRERDQEARTMKRSQSTHSTPSPFTFDNLEDQTSHALHTLRVLERMFEGSQTFEFMDEDFEAMAGLLYDTRLFLEPLDLRGVAGALQIGEFAIVQDKGAKRPTIACARCSGEARQK